MPSLLLILWGCMLSGLLPAQQREYFPFFQQEFFFGNLPSIRAEAMGRADVSMGGTVSSLFYNPAAIGTLDHWAVDLSTSAPYYLLTQSDFFFAGAAYRIHPRLVVGLSGNLLAVGQTNFTVDIDGRDYPIDKPKSGVLALSIAGEPLRGLHLGTNLNFFGWKLFNGVPSAKSFLLDLGGLYRLELGEQQRRLQLGVSVNNLTASSITFRAPDGAEDSNVFPVILRAGATFQQEFYFSLPGVDQEVPFGLTGTIEYQDLLNNPYRTAFRVGTELVVARVLAFRLGFFTRSEDDFGVENNKDRVNDFTYGFGIIVPLESITNGSLPVNIHLDYYALENPPLVESGPRRPNKRGFGLRLVSPITQD